MDYFPRGGKCINAKGTRKRKEPMRKPAMTTFRLAEKNEKAHKKRDEKAVAFPKRQAQRQTLREREIRRKMGGKGKEKKKKRRRTRRLLSARRKLWQKNRAGTSVW